MNRTFKAVSGAGLSALLCTAGVATATSASAQGPALEPEEGDHCVAEALPPELVASASAAPDMVCFDTFAEVGEFLGAGDARALEGLTPVKLLEDPAYAAAADNVLAIHWNFMTNPGTLTINGGQCEGGGLTLAGHWKNRIEATIHKGCGNIKHWDGDNYTGDVELTQGNWDDSVWLDPLSNRVNSVRYWA